jgi:Ran GTPase-activating protein (RanGAP) involved in mRNA processing and transport
MYNKIFENLCKKTKKKTRDALSIRHVYLFVLFINYDNACCNSVTLNSDNLSLYFQQVNGSVETLDLSDNDMGEKGAEYLADALRENTFVRSLVSVLFTLVSTINALH